MNQRHVVGIFCFFFSSAPAVAVEHSTSGKCDVMLKDGKCLKLLDGKVFIDGKEQKNVTAHTSDDARKARTELPKPLPGVERISAVYDKDSLAAYMKKEGNSGYTLPQFYLIDLATGQIASKKELPKPLVEFVNANVKPTINTFRAMPSSSLLDSLLAISRHTDGTPLRREELNGMRYVAFQFWASWCVGCMEEAEKFSELLHQHPMRELAWIALETDPLAIDNDRSF